MPRPCCLRRIGFTPTAGLFRPAGIAVCALEQVTLTLDEVEALRLADLNGLYQDQAAREMGISRPTFARIVEAARRKVAEALIHGKALRLEGGVVQVKGTARGRKRGRCGCGRHHERKVPCDAAPDSCCGRETESENKTRKGERKS